MIGLAFLILIASCGPAFAQLDGPKPADVWAAAQAAGVFGSLIMGSLLVMLWRHHLKNEARHQAETKEARAELRGMLERAVVAIETNARANHALAQVAEERNRTADTQNAVMAQSVVELARLQELLRGGKAK